MRTKIARKPCIFFFIFQGGLDPLPPPPPPGFAHEANVLFKCFPKSSSGSFMFSLSNLDYGTMESICCMVSNFMPLVFENMSFKQKHVFCVGVKEPSL